MSEVLQYKCPKCGGSISFDPNLQKLLCPYCDTEFELENIKAYNEAESTDKQKSNTKQDEYTEESGNGNWQAGETDNIVAYQCQTCGGEVIGDKQTAATSCPYCGNSVIITKQFSGLFRPDYVIPFKLDRKAAKDKFYSFLKGKILLPKEFKDNCKIEEVTGLYVPYWLFQCDVDAHMRFKATTTTTWDEGDERVTRTDHYDLERGGILNFDKIPVDGSTKINEKYTESI